MNNNIFINNKTKILKEGSFIILAAALIVSGFFVANFALAEHTATVTVDQTVVKGGVPITLNFTINKDSGNGIANVRIEQSDFSNFSSLTCPAGWTTSIGSTYIECNWVSGEPLITSSQIISFNATAPATSGVQTWSITTKDIMYYVDPGANPAQDNSNDITVDADAPTISLITTKDTNSDGRIETVTIVFSEPIDDSTFLAEDFTISGVQANSINTETADDNAFDIIFTEGIEGTEAKDVTYTQRIGADLVGNLLAGFTQTSLDGAAPVFLFAKATTDINVDVTFSEPISIVDGVDLSTTITATNLIIKSGTENGSILTLTVNSFDDTAYTVSNLAIFAGIVEDAANNHNDVVLGGVITDGQKPAIISAETKTITEIELTFSEPMNLLLKTDFIITDNTISGVTFITGESAVILTLNTAIGAGDTPQVSTIANPIETKDSAENLIIGNLSLISTDGIKPIIESATVNPDPAKAGEVAITVVFSESMNVGVSPTVQITGIIGSPIDVTQSSYIDDTWTGTFILPDNDEEVTATIFVARAEDTSGNIMTEDVEAGTFNVDTIEPSAPNIALTGTINIVNQSTVAITGSGEANAAVDYSISDGTSSLAGSGTVNAEGIINITPINVSSLDDGTLTVTVTLMDVAGNISVPGIDTATKDTIAPSIVSITSDATELGWLKVEDTISFTLTPTTPEIDAQVAGSYNDQSLDWTTSNSGVTYTAIYTVTEGDSDQLTPLQINGVVIIDAVGNPSAIGSGSDIAKTIDANTPVAPMNVSLTDPINIANQTAVIITGSGEADTTVNYSIKDEDTNTVSGIDTVNGSGEINITSINVSTLSDGTLTLTVTLTDIANNISTPSIDTAIKDTLAPVVKITFPLTADVVNGNAVITFDNSELTNPQCSVDESIWVDCKSGTTKLSGVTGFADLLEEGTFTLYLKDTDSADNTGTDSETSIIKDTTNPSIDSLTAPEADVVYKVAQGGVLLTFTTSDENSISCSYTVDSGTFGVDCSGGTIPDSNLNDGREEVVITVVDTAGNSAESSLISFVFDDNDTLTVGDVDEDFASIQVAIDAASANDTIAISVGTYTEDLKINTEGIKLAGADKATTFIQGVSTVSAVSWPLAGPNIEILATGVKIHGFTIQSPDYVSGYYSSGIVIGASNVEIYGNDFQTNAVNSTGDISQTIQTYAEAAMPGVDVSGLNIHDNAFTHQGTGNWGYEGIYINPQNTPVGTVTIQNNQFTEKVIRAITSERSKTTINGNTIITDQTPSDLSTPGSWRGIQIGSNVTSDVVISGNTVKGSVNGNGFYQGILVKSADGVTVSDKNVFEGNTVAIQNNYVDSLNAVNNYWNTAVASTIAGKISGEVVYEPYYVNEEMTILSNVAPTIVYVDDDYTDGNFGGYIFGYNTFATIQEGIDAVAENGTVNIEAGTYDEDVLIDKSLTLKSVNGKASTIINGQSTASTGAVKVAASNVVIGGTNSGFTINGAGQTAIYLNSGTSNIVVQDNIVNAASGKNAFLTEGGVSDHTISGNSFGGDGSQLVYVNGQASVGNPSTNVDFIGNTFGGTATGPALGQEATNSEISGNTFETVTGYVGLELWASGNTVINNTITGAYNGITIDGGPYGTYNSVAILGNTITDFTKGGIVVKDVLSVQIEGNSISTTDYSVAPNGIQIGYVMDLTETTGTINNNIVGGCHWSGYNPAISYEGDNNWTGSGILVIAPNSALTISGNEVQNSDVGLDIEAGPSTSIQNNDVYNNSYGFVLWNAYPTINLNNIFGNNLSGVYRTTDGSSDGVLNAKKNWWGHQNGPQHSTNPGADENADSVSDNVDFRPWYTNINLIDLDTEAPTVTVDTLLTNDETPTVTGTVSDNKGSGDVEVIITINSISYNATVDSGDDTWSAEVTNTLPEATYDVLVDVEDQAGNQDSVSIVDALTIDITDPTLNPVSISSSNTNPVWAKVNDTIALSFTSNENIEMLSVTIAGEVATVSDGPTIWSAKYTMIGTEIEDVIPFTINFTDLAGNTGGVVATTDSSSVTFDKTAPTAPIITFIAGDNYINDLEKATIEIIGTAEDGSTVNVTLTDTNNGTITGSGIATGGNYTITVDGSNLLDGTITPSVTATDVAGNVGSAAVTPTAIKETIAPTVVSHIPTVNAMNVQPTNDIVVTFSEAVIVKVENINFSPAVTNFNLSGSGSDTITISSVITLADNTPYTITLSTNITDEVGNPLAEIYSWQFTITTTYEIQLYTNDEGWNLISLPVVPNNTSIENVLGGASTNIDAVWTYAPNGPSVDDSGWFVYKPLNPLGTNNLDTMTSGYGYWVSVLNNTSISGWGSLFTAGPTVPPSRTLSPGWNMIGYYQLPGTDYSTPSAAFSSLKNVSGERYWTSLWGFNNESGVFNSVSNISPGDAFWMSLRPDNSEYFYTPGN